MDPLSMTASLIAVLDLTAKFTSYLNDVAHAKEEQRRLLAEACQLQGLLTGLRYRVEAVSPDNSWFNQVKQLAQDGGPLDQFKKTLEQMVGQLPSQKTQGQVMTLLTWTWNKKQISGTLQRTERLKSLILCALAGDMSKMMEILHEEVDSLNKQVRQLGLRTTQLLSRSDQDLQHRMAQWLGVPDPSTNYRSALDKRQPNTGRWLVNSTHFSQWQNEVSALMWLHGNVGCGKTVLSAAALQELIRLRDADAGIAVVYFYFDFNDTEKQWSEKMVRSLLYQLSWQISKAQQVLESLYHHCGDGQQQPARTTIRELLRESLAVPCSTYIILDALDECTDREDLLDFLSSIVQLKLAGVRVLATSRREREIEEQLLPTRAVVDEDIRLYIDARLATDPKLKKWSDSVRFEISDTLMKKANGMFRWVPCQLESIRRCIKLPKLREALSGLPRTLDETYERILRQLESEGNLSDAISVLRWLCFSDRPLRLSEAAEILAIDVETSKGFSRDDRLPDPMDIMVICSSLITIHHEAESLRKDITRQVQNSFSSDNTDTHEMMIRLAHFSVKEYLLSQRCAFRSEFDTSLAHQHITEACLHYLLHVAQQRPLTKTVSSQYPLSQHAAKEWWQHAREISGVDGQNCVSLALRLLNSDKMVLLSCIQLFNPDEPWVGTVTSLPATKIAPALYYAALAGLTDIARDLLANGADSNAEGGRYGTPLQSAAARGHIEMVQMLLNHGANLEGGGGVYNNALQAAAWGGHIKVIQMLLDRGADIQAEGGKYGNALQTAAAEGHSEIVQMLLDHGANINAKGGGYGNALQAAAWRGDSKVLQMLLDRGANIQAEGGKYGNTLQAAAAGGDITSVQVLLDRGADIRAEGGKYGNALQAASADNHLQVVQALLDRGADIQAEGGKYNNALQAAAAEGHTEVVQILLDRGANVNAVEGYYGNALQAAVEEGHSEVVQILEVAIYGEHK